MTSADPWVTEWDPPNPTEIPDLRSRLAAQMRTDTEHEQTTMVLDQGLGSIVPNIPDSRMAAGLLLLDEHERLTNATLYYTTREMTELAVTAGGQLPDFRCDPSDPPAEHGFMVFEQPIGSYVNETGGEPALVPIVAVSWGPWSPGKWPPMGAARGRQVLRSREWPDGGVWLTFYSPSDMDRAVAMHEHRTGRRMPEETVRRVRGMRAPLAWDNEAALVHGLVEPVTDTPPEGEGDARRQPVSRSVGEWVQSVRAAWLLMQQPNIAEMEDRPLSRAARRRAERAGDPTAGVRLLHLRRQHHPAPETGEGEGERESVEWSCRWLVRGYWRNTWYPSREVHRPQWIAPHVKGPEGKPLRGGETVHIWDR